MSITRARLAVATAPQYAPQPSLSDAVGAARSRVKPNNARMRAIRNTLAGLPCMTCGHDVDWSRETGQHGHAGAAWIGHVIATETFETGGGYIAGNIGAHCRTCQYDARRLPDGGMDLTPYIIPDTVPQRFLSQRAADDMADVRDVAPMVAPTTAAQRRASRFALWGW